MTPLPRTLDHGGPDAAGVPRHDFSSNANAAGPLRPVARAVARADRRYYPDTAYTDLRRHLAAWHGCTPERIVPAASASEFIQRCTRVLAAAGVSRVLRPVPGYGDYAAAARATGLALADDAGDGCATDAATLHWITEPMSPSGAAHPPVALAARLDAARDAGATVVLDLAYHPLRLVPPALPTTARAAWQLWSPNKACGMTGVRAAYAIAPPGAEPLAAALTAQAASWPIGADGVALLTAFADDAAQMALAAALARLAGWRERLAALLRRRGWQLQDAASVTPFFCARPPRPLDAAALRRRGIKLRDTAGMGLPGWWRLSAQPPRSLRALDEALEAAPDRPLAGGDRPRAASPRAGAIGRAANGAPR